MKTSRLLHETDLARTALLPKDEKLAQLRNIRDFIPTYSWSPFRAALPGIFQAKKTLLDLPRVTWPDVDAAIRRSCRKYPKWLEGNLQLAKLVFDDVAKANLTSVEWSFGSLPVGFGSVVKFWPEFYSVDEGRPLVTYSDPRRGHGLTKVARKFVFSNMHHHIARGDFSEAFFRIAVFPVDNGKKTRSIRYFEMRLEDIVGVDELNLAIQETYQLWFEILEEREKEARRTPRTGTDDLFG